MITLILIAIALFLIEFILFTIASYYDNAFTFAVAVFAVVTGAVVIAGVVIADVGAVAVAFAGAFVGIFFGEYLRARKKEAGK